jgi:hypothetical protein
MADVELAGGAHAAEDALFVRGERSGRQVLSVGLSLWVISYKFLGIRASCEGGKSRFLAALGMTVIGVLGRVESVRGARNDNLSGRWAYGVPGIVVLGVVLLDGVSAGRVLRQCGGETSRFLTALGMTISRGDGLDDEGGDYFRRSRAMIILWTSLVPS